MYVGQTKILLIMSLEIMSTYNKLPLSGKEVALPTNI